MFSFTFSRCDFSSKVDDAYVWSFDGNNVNSICLIMIYVSVDRSISGMYYKVGSDSGIYHRVFKYFTCHWRLFPSLIKHGWLELLFRLICYLRLFGCYCIGIYLVGRCSLVGVLLCFLGQEVLLLGDLVYFQLLLIGFCAAWYSDLPFSPVVVFLDPTGFNIDSRFLKNFTEKKLPLLRSCDTQSYHLVFSMEKEWLRIHCVWYRLSSF